MLEFQKLQAQLGNLIDEDIVTSIALGISNTKLSDEQKCDVLQNIINTTKPTKGLTREQLIRRFIFIREDLDNMCEWLTLNEIDADNYNHKGCSLNTYITNFMIVSDMDEKGIIGDDMDRVETDWMTQAEYKAKNDKKAKYDKIIAELNEMEVDGEMMQYIIEGTNMNDQMLRQLILTNPQSDTIDLLDEHIKLNNNSLK